MRSMTRRTYGQRPAAVDPDADELPPLAPVSTEPVVRLAPGWRESGRVGQGLPARPVRRTLTDGDSDPGR